MKFEENQENRMNSNFTQGFVEAMTGPYTITLDEYDGNPQTDLESWLVKLSDILDNESPRLTDDQKITRLPLFLTGVAREHFKSIETENKSFSDVKRELKALCESEEVRNEALLKLNLLRRRSPYEDLEDFISRFEKIARQATTGLKEEVVEQKLFENFVMKLDRELEFQVRSRDVKNYNDALKVARKMNSLLKMKFRDKYGNV